MIDGMHNCDLLQTPVAVAMQSVVPPLPVKMRRMSKIDLIDGAMKNSDVAVMESCTTMNCDRQFVTGVVQKCNFMQTTNTELIRQSTRSRFVHHSISDDNFKSSLSHEQQFSVFESSTASLQNSLPPLPPKLKHTVAYMSAFGQYSLSPFEDAIPRNPTSRSRPYPYSIMEPSFDLQQFVPNQYQSADHSALHSSYSVDTFSMASGYCSYESIRQKQDDIPPLPPKVSVSEAKRVVAREDRDSSISLTSHSSDQPFLSPEPKEPVSATVSCCSSPESLLQLPAHDSSKDSSFVDTNTLDSIDVINELVLMKAGEDGPKVRGGSVDALIVHATTGASDFLYQEAFLATYRTFIAPSELIKKLLYRYNHFSKIADVKKKKLANNTFSLLVRVVNELCTETDEHILQILMELVCQLVCDGELMLARTMRKKVLEKCEHHRRKLKSNQKEKLLSDYHLTVKCHKLTDFKSEAIAEQMTLLDAELFQKIEIPEVLLWAREQSEESCPNLTKFTEHFNKMSYWCRTRILEHHEDPRERERHFKKLIKIMQHLRRLNNFNSYLAILSAVDSAPVRRLEWQKQNVEALKEYCTIIDSSSSFCVYRQALAKAEPPCIPYIGLVLQDLTFVHIGNPDKLPDGNINFMKCWQMFTILNNMQRFGKCNYGFKKNEKIIAFCNNFVDFISEESLWQISEKIKPRASKRVDT
jgi:Rap guanine nucleotide exchange factor 1